MKPTEFDLARAEFYKLHPEAIVSVGEWENIYTCKICGTELDPADANMHQTINGLNRGYSSAKNYNITPDDVACPCCLNHRVTQIYTAWNTVCDSEPIECILIRRRKIITSSAVAPGWWARLKGEKAKPEQFFYEYHPDTLQPLNETKVKVKR